MYWLELSDRRHARTHRVRQDIVHGVDEVDGEVSCGQHVDSSGPPATHWEELVVGVGIIGIIGACMHGGWLVGVG